MISFLHWQKTKSFPYSSLSVLLKVYWVPCLVLISKSKERVVAVPQAKLQSGCRSGCSWVACGHRWSPAPVGTAVPSLPCRSRWCTGPQGALGSCLGLWSCSSPALSWPGSPYLRGILKCSWWVASHSTSLPLSHSCWKSRRCPYS